MQLKGIIMKNMLIEPKYQGIVFDLDGTLINSLADLIDSLNIVMEYYDLPPKTYEEGKKLIGRGLRNLVKRALPRKLSRSIRSSTKLFRSCWTNIRSAGRTRRVRMKTFSFCWTI